MGNKKMRLYEMVDGNISSLIDTKLREFNFYTADEKKGKSKITFNDTDRDEITRHFDDLSEKYPEDVAFIRSVVLAKGFDDKRGQHVVRLGSYYDKASINLPFSKKTDGLGSLLDGGVIYFTIMNNAGPDDRDFKIVPGDKLGNMDFEKPKTNTERNPNINDTQGKELQPYQKVQKVEPFENVMKVKEKKGLETLLNTNQVNSDLTKSQKELIRNLKTRGYLFVEPHQNSENYTKKRIQTKEFNEAINVWEPRRK